MPKEAKKISADRLLIWLSLYMITAIPAFLKLYQTIPIGLICILILEEIVCYHIFEDELLEAYMDQVEKPGFTIGLLATSIGVMLITLIWSFFYEWKFVVLLGIVEIIAYIVRTFIKIKSSRDA
ncbi:MAG: hypothetical protein ACLSH8_16755 [Zhenhengia sp.]|uniref:hypothetical protein n=1 Tax=Zhenhengia sp. TaxID=2944208 RepID=UPI002908B0EB|nr:hypothetical protein [Clostridiales bacterium]MDU6975857.1 hypothetical protein [Clostridiales bacterium]